VVRVNLMHPSSGYERTCSFEFTTADWVIHPEHDLAVCALPHDMQPNLYNIALIDVKFLFTEKDVVGQNIPVALQEA